ncbi:SDR family NAD(P)-dependent oxidoreductase, partial [Streptomyces sp. NPDC019531]|uniref:SDR family NAD(P)-dependent oxidoreductase n=1 Tax=Streptomyces sp. NPDC019531 TaxID=3365062 RepID=UPI00384FE69A
FRGEGRRVRWLEVSHAFHSPLMEPMLEDFRQVVGKLTFHPATVPAVSTVTGEPDPAWDDPEYWVEHVRRPVRYGDAVTALDTLGVTRFVEIGPQGVLTALTQQNLPDDTRAVTAVPSLRAGQDEPHTLLTALARLHVTGVPVDWQAFYKGEHALRIDLPTYAFQHDHYWTQAAAPAVQRADALDAAFWDAVESEQPDDFAELLGVEAGAVSAVLPAMARMRGRQRDQQLMDSWRYRVEWRSVPLGDGPGPTGTWLVLLPARPTRGELAERILDGLAAQGVKAVPVEASGADRAALAVILAEHAAEEAPQGVLSLLALDVADSTEHPGLSRGCADTVVLAQALADAALTARLWVVTSGAVAVGQDKSAAAPQAAVWGVGTSLSLEQPDTWGGLIDIPEDPDDETVRRLCAVPAEAVEAGEDRLAVRTTGVHACRMVRAPGGDGIHNDPVWAPRGTVLVTGGTGGLGAHVARTLAALGAPELLLTSRRGPAADGAAELAAELEALGTSVRIEACDVADRDRLAALLSSVPEDRPLSAVVHAAGVPQRIAPLTELTLEGFAEVGRAKVLGARHLDDLLGDQPLDAFVLFSSGSAVWGSAGQAAYAGANAYLDGLARQRRARGRIATAIAWGSWQGGMVDEELAAVMRRIGAPAMDPERALACLRRELAWGEAHVVVADFDWDRFVPTYTMARPRPLLDLVPEVRELLDSDGDNPRDASAPVPDLVARLAQMPPAEQSRTLLTLVRTHVAELLGYDDPAELDPGRAFDDLGFDSVVAVDLRNRLARATGRKLPSTMVFDYANPVALAEYLRTELCPDGNAPTAQAVLEQLARLETTVTGFGAEEIAELNIVPLLRALAARLGESPDTAEDVDTQLESASADDVFDFIDKELGLT